MTRVGSGPRVERPLDALEAKQVREVATRGPTCTPEKAAKVHNEFLAAIDDPGYVGSEPDLSKMSAADAWRAYKDFMREIEI